jgi:hypothetical protein
MLNVVLYSIISVAFTVWFTATIRARWSDTGPWHLQGTVTPAARGLQFGLQGLRVGAGYDGQPLNGGALASHLPLVAFGRRTRLA